MNSFGFVQARLRTIVGEARKQDKWLLDPHVRLVTLTGAPGTGKTLAPADLHAYAAFRAQCERGRHIHLLVRDLAETPLLGNRTQDEHALHHGELLTDAQARTTAERKVGEAR